MALRDVKDLGASAVRRFVEIEGLQQATVLAAQAFTSLIPFLVIVTAFGPGEGDLADKIVERFDLGGETEQRVRALFNSAGESRSALPWVSVGILVVSATSFSRAMKRTFERAYRVEPGGLKEAWRALAWLGGFGLWVVVSGPVRSGLADTGGILLAVVASAVTGFWLWLGTPLVLLRGIPWRRLLPGAMVTSVLVSLAGIASAIYVPLLMTRAAERYGLIGIALSLQSWLVVIAVVVVAGAVIGASVSSR